MSYTINNALEWGQSQLKVHHIPLHHQEAMDLLSECIHQPRVFLLTHENKKIRPESWRRYQQLIQKRGSGIPFAYCVGWIPFAGLRLAIGPGVLIPRPETEELVEHIIASSCTPPNSIADVGTGSGCIALTLARRWPGSTIIATDRSSRALTWARKNRSRLNTANIHFKHRSYLRGVRQRFDLVVANLPYLSLSIYRQYSKEIRYEPRQALVSRDRGRFHSVTLINQLSNNLAPNAHVWIECSPQTIHSIATVAKRLFKQATLHKERDRSGRLRFLSIITKTEQLSSS